MSARFFQARSANANANSEPLVNAPIDTKLLKRQLHRAQRERKLMALALIAPLFLFLVGNFLIPVGTVLFKSVDDREVSLVFLRTALVIEPWTGPDIPGEAVFKAFAEDLRQGHAERTLHSASKRLNSVISGYQALLSKTARNLPAMEPTSWKVTIIDIDARWGKSEYWFALKQSTKPYTLIYLLNAFDLTLDQDGHVTQVDVKQRAFNTIWLRTAWMALFITALCVMLGYPLAFVMANSSQGIANFMMVLVLLPFWTAILVRTTAWMVLLQREGVLNDLGLFLGLWNERVQLIHNRFGVYVTMVHILLPFIVLPLYGIMRRINPHFMRAAKSLGARPAVAFARVYWPQTKHGVGAGAMFVFILAVGFYVTPALVGGREDQMISWFIAFYANETLNWGMAAALSTLLLVFQFILYVLLSRAFGIGRLKFG